MGKLKLYKRYANRRLYDAESSKTATLDDVARAIKDGFEVRIIDNANGEDITSQTLSKTFLKLFTEDRNPDFSNFLLTTLIREISLDVGGFFGRLLQGGFGAGFLTRERLERILRNMVTSGELSISEKNDYLRDIQEQIRHAAQGVESRAQGDLDFLRDEFSRDKSEKIDELSARLDEMARLIHDMKEEGK